jgi:ankyrin repeat protein
MAGIPFTSLYDMIIWKRVQLLLEYAIDKNPADGNFVTPLHDVAKNGHLEMDKLLQKNTKDKNPEDKNGLTPIHLALLNGQLD